MKTIHVISHAHLDPVWLWSWQAGLDETLATCRSACDRLDANPQLYFSQGESWVYEQIEKADPDLFERIKKYIKNGRWEIIGGWYLQPDCNFPAGIGMEKQIALGKHYFQKHFDTFSRCGFNPDSFGHAASLPGIMKKYGQDQYIFMRPDPEEMANPSCLFRWRGYAGGPEVTTFRIAEGYNFQPAENEESNLNHFKASLKDLPEGIEHTMCFVGIGDHGGGPSQRMIDWVLAHRDSIPDAKIEFSTSKRFFEAISDRIKSLPLVEGELQHHAIGCYTIVRQTKNLSRKGEMMLRQAENIALNDPEAAAENTRALERAWKRVCFSQFHDTIEGTCLPSAYKQIDAQLGEAVCIADEMLHVTLRRMNRILPEHPLQQIVIHNPSESDFDDYIEFEPWLNWAKLSGDFQLLDEDGIRIPVQIISTEAMVWFLNRIVFKLKVKSNATRVLRIDMTPLPQSADSNTPRSISSDGIRIGQTAVDFQKNRLIFSAGDELEMPMLTLIDDPTDTWSHGIDRYSETPVAIAQWSEAVVADAGELMNAVVRKGTVGSSPVVAEWRVYKDEPCIELRLRVHWIEEKKVLKLVLPSRARILDREDGIMGGSIKRASDGAERPLQDRTLLTLENGIYVGVVCPDTYAADATESRIRFTLLRSPLMAHHDPDKGSGPRRHFTDHGENTFIFRFYMAKNIDGKRLDRNAMNISQPLIIADRTKGMRI